MLEPADCPQTVPGEPQQQLLSHFRFSDGALKAVGVGAAGSRCGIAVFVGSRHPDDVLVLQGKQAEASVLAPYVQATAPEHQGKRMVQGQRLLQTSSDAFLGWTLAKAHARSAGWKATQTRAGQHLLTHGPTTHDRRGKNKKATQNGWQKRGKFGSG
jgi:uncharacterized protein (DUF2252 family)